MTKSCESLEKVRDKVLINLEKVLLTENVLKKSLESCADWNISNEHNLLI